DDNEDEDYDLIRVLVRREKEGFVVRARDYVAAVRAHETDFGLKAMVVVVSSHESVLQERGEESSESG
nr:hypothetical protein [Tanacetum cinerariifolium]